MIRIMTVCGMGLGSSLLASMTAERTLKAAGIDRRAYDIETSDVGSARRADVDIYLTTQEFASQISDWGKQVVVVTNVFDEGEMKRQLMPAVRELVPDD